MQIVLKHLEPAEFEEEAGCTDSPNWRKNILVDPGPSTSSRGTVAMPLGRWLSQNGISVGFKQSSVFREPDGPKGLGVKRPPSG